ncbi:anthranilate synthase beta subunit 1, chloroplastic-like [Iris pallida]|uniref:Anthranilate synthase beta subunit 1, chloroplastic-like n=1 Tax=Iris pallida TaxID=29817 RepID=A0AAX6DYV3_IRIPA|nr:anthranilate synthase beta subunit 1, chloroplastic-like [Iris pallida]
MNAIRKRMNPRIPRMQTSPPISPPFLSSLFSNPNPSHGFSLSLTETRPSRQNPSRNSPPFAAQRCQFCPIPWDWERKGTIFVAESTGGDGVEKARVSVEEKREVERRSNPNPIIVIDNYDSFTYNICQYMGALGANLRCTVTMRSLWRK